MKRTIPESTSDLAGHASPIPPGGFEPESQQVNEDRAVGRRALLTRGGVLVASVVGAGAAATAVGGRAGAAAGAPTLPGKSDSVPAHAAPPRGPATHHLAPTSTMHLTQPAL